MSQKTRRKSRRSFGPTAPPFIDYLKEVLRRYPDGGQILKELIQNADDAGATQVVFLHDERSYDTEDLWTESLGKYQGPALYAYNDAVFTDEDWAGIQTAGRSVKRDDPNKVGRFGIGFNSVYHITDLPSVFSSGHLGFMDPQEKIFGEREVGCQWSLSDSEDQDTLMNCQDQFKPFRDIVSVVSEKRWSEVVCEDQHFDGTIFRFPLRNEVSEISDNIYDSQKVTELYESFIADADLSLIFLKNVMSVTLIRIDLEGRVHKRLMVQSSRSNGEPVLESGDDPFVKGSTGFKNITINNGEHQEMKWLVTSCTMKEGVEETLDSLGKKLSFFPQVDLAFPCGERSSGGRLSCFLPLPNNDSNKTGFPVYVNACFGLTDNRRYIKWQEEDQKNDEHAVWNELLMNEVLPHGYVLMIQHAIKLAQISSFPVSAVYDIWPDVNEMQHKEKWCPIAHNILDQLFSKNVPLLSLAKDQNQFVTPAEALFLSNEPMSPEVLLVIKNTLVSHGENLVMLPNNTQRTLMDVYPESPQLKHVTPAFLRSLLHTFSVDELKREDKLLLLEYILSDGEYEDLLDLKLLPLSDGSFICFSTKEEDTALVDSEEFPRALLPCCKHRFIPEDVSSSSRNHLTQLARTGMFKLVDLNTEKVLELTRRHMPEEWKTPAQKIVTWDVRNNMHPPLAWLQLFWRFLNTNVKELRCLIDLPLIPLSPLSDSQPVSLAKLSQNTTLIFQSDKRSTLPKQIVELVKQVGGTVVPVTGWLQHEDLHSFILYPSARSVLKVLSHLDLSHVMRSFKTVSPVARQELKKHLSGLDSFSDREKEVCLKLPLLQNVKGSYVEAQSKKAVLLESGLSLPIQLPFPDSVVLCVTDDDRRLLQLLKIEMLNQAEAAELLIHQIEESSCNRDQVKQIMSWILQHGNLLFAQSQKLKKKCKALEFIEVNGVMKNMSSFFDPRVQTFQELFGAEFFPPETYMETQQMLDSLVNLGLIVNEGDVTPEHLLHVARRIVRLIEMSPGEAFNKSVVLLNLLEAYNSLSKFSQEQLNTLKGLKWVGQRIEKSHTFFCPNDARHPMYKDIVGHVMPLMGNLSNKLSLALGLKCLPPPEKVIENLMYLTSKAETIVDLDTNVDFHRQLLSIYKHMQDHTLKFVSILSKEARWLWNQNQFVSPKELVLDYPPGLDISSRIGKLPKEFRPYKNLLMNFGLRESLSDDEIVGILISLTEPTEDGVRQFASASEVKVAIEILNWLWREKKTVENDIPVPVIAEEGKYVFKPLSMAVFCDVSNNGLEDLTLNNENIYVIHEEIFKATADWLGIRLLSTHILNPELVGIEQCGQSEPITMRIKNILKEYDEEKDLFKELIQNAEDAGAKCCKFLVDYRVHQDNSKGLIDPGMAQSQGPCLWAFNNEQFTTEDWNNIVRVGSASKENKLEKIGKFGLGFNTVYHVTDLPSILSGKHLLILDPNVTHLQKHIKNQTNPGIKLDLSQQTLLKCFPDQFSPYENIFDCSLAQRSPPTPYHGTLIKLPFRTEAEANESEISQKVFDKHRIDSFQDNLKSNSQTHLLFLKNINSLTLQNLSKDASTPPKAGEFEDLLFLSKTIENTLPVPDGLLEKQKNAVQQLQQLDRECQNVIKCNIAEIVKITSKQLGESAEDQFWLQYNCFGTDESLKIAIGQNTEAKCSLPIGGIALPLKRDQINEEFQPTLTENSGEAFCFLPLSIHTGLPVNVNGTFAVTSNRKGLWVTGIKHEWNVALLQDPLVTAYVTTLLILKSMSENQHLVNYCYHSYWPDRREVIDTFKPLVDKFYSTISQNSFAPKLLSDGKHWCSMKDAVFLHESIQEDQSFNDLAMQVCDQYTNNVVPLPPWLRNSFREAGLKDVLEKKTWNWDKFFQSVVFENLATMDTKIRDSLVLHAIDLGIKELDDLLVLYQCIPTTDGQLQFIKNLVNPFGKVACLFEESEGKLLGGEEKGFRSPERIKRLIELGMVNDNLPLKQITERACLVKNTWISDKKKAYAHLQCLFELMRGQIKNENQAEWQALRNTEFLPAFQPGDIKMEKCLSFKKPTDVFNDKCSLLVNMTHHVLDLKGLKIHNCDPILQILKVCDSPTEEMVLNQLEVLQKQSKLIDKTSCYRIAGECYRYLDQWLCDSKNPNIISERAKSFPFIFVGKLFVNVSCVAEAEQFELKPYLHVLPPSFANFNNLWRCVGVQKTFTNHQLLMVLQELKKKNKNGPMQKADLKMCLKILRGMHDAAEEMPANVLIPNSDAILQPASNLFFNDSPWMPMDPNLKLCHEDIPRNMALRFGIPTTRHQTLQNHLNQKMSPYAFHFEQHEELTQRIGNILSAYPSKKDILKELIQNADDAEASEIHFVWDRREHGRVKTFGEKWKSLQGPALCVYNNKVFSDADLKGIQQLGQGGKRNIPGKIGKYGVGFNSVYHLTDCPSILTGDSLLCIFDPNRSYIEDQSERPPMGVGYTLDDTVKEMYQDIYRSFLPDKFCLTDGTMFRLPLRNSEMANSSKISGRAFSEDDMRELCSVFSENPEGLIMFLKNIKRIQMHEITNDSDELHCLYSVEKYIPETSDKKEKEHFDKLLEHSQQFPQSVAPSKVIYECVISTSDERESKWIIAEQFGSDIQVTPADKLPQVAISMPVILKHKNETLNVRDFKGEAFCSLPLPGKTCLPAHINGNFEVDFSRRCLWKEDGQNVKSDWNETLKEKIIAPLYAELLDHIRRHLPNTKVRLSGIESSLRSTYLCFWPIICDDVSPEWHEMIHSVYRFIEQRGLPLIPVMKRSTRTIAGITFQEYSFEWCDIQGTETTERPYMTKNNSDEINAILEDLGMKLVPDSREMNKIREGFEKAGIKVKLVKPSSVRAYLKLKPLNDPQKTSANLPLPLEKTMIKTRERWGKLVSFCLQDLRIKKNPHNSLTGLPLLLTSDDVVRVFSTDSPKLQSRYISLFCGYEQHFISSHLEFNDLLTLKKFHLVSDVTVPFVKEWLKEIIQSLLSRCVVNPQNGLHTLNKTTASWLQILWKFFADCMSVKAKDGKASLTLKDVQQLFSDFCILPVVCPRLEKELFLVKMKDMSGVVWPGSKDNIYEILLKLGSVQHCSVFFKDVERDLICQLSTELLDTRDCYSVLDHIYNLERSEFSQLFSSDMETLQIFLQSGVSNKKDNQDYLTKLRCLPLFETIHGERVSINPPQIVFVLDINKDTISRYPGLFKLLESNKVFLKNNPQNHSMAPAMGIEVLNQMKYFMKFILPRAERLDQRQMVQCLKLILTLQQEPEYSKHKDAIISKMKSLKVICSSQGQMESAAYYFDEDVVLFKVMLPPERIVPQTVWEELCGENMYTKSSMKKLLKELGMKHRVSKDDIIDFAREIELESKRQFQEELRKKSCLVFQTALSMTEKQDTEETAVLVSIADTEFIFPVKIKAELCDFHPPFRSPDMPVKINGSLIGDHTDHQQLIWSSMPIINVPQFGSKVGQILTEAGAFKLPPPQCIIKNLINVCQSPCGSEHLLKTRAKLFRSSYDYLQSMKFEERLLDGLPMVLVERDTKLVKADETSLMLEDDLDFRPYLYKIQPKDVRYTDFFRQIGVRENPVVEQYCNVLAAVHADSKDKEKINPNQNKTVKRTIQQLFNLIGKTKEQSKSLFKDVKKMFLLSVDGSLYPSNSLYYNDTTFDKQRLEDALQNKFQLIEKFRKCHLGNDTYEHQRLLHLLPEQFQPKMLSQFTEEKLAQGNQERCQFGTNCQFSGWFDRHLTSEAFHYGLICLIRQHSNGKVTHDEAANLCGRIFGSIQIVCCNSLRTELWMQGEALSNTTAKTIAFLKREPIGCIFYLEHKDNMSERVKMIVTSTLTEEVLSLFHGQIAPKHKTVIELLVCDNLEEVKETLVRHKIHISGEGGCDTSSSTAPGEEIPEEWHDSLDMNVLNNYEEGEYVGYYTNNKYVYAVILEEVPGSTGLYSRRFIILHGKDEPIEVSCVDIYQIKCGQETTSGSTEMQLFAGEVPPASSQPSSKPTRSSPTSLQEAKEEIDRCLAEIWTLPEDLRDKAIKRLYLRWHPDKNPDYEQLATEAFKYLQKEIEEMIKGKGKGKGKGKSSGRTSGFSSSSGFNFNFRTWDDEARSHRRHRENFTRGNGGNRGNRGQRSYNFWSYHNNVPRPDRSEARRWFRQARCDLNAAKGDSLEWCLFKIHQAVEKALIAAEYKRNGKRPEETSIYDLAEKVKSYNVKLADMPTLVRELKELEVDAKRTQYPNYHPSPHIPNEMYTSENATRALEKASALLNAVNEYVN